MSFLQSLLSKITAALAAMHNAAKTIADLKAQLATANASISDLTAKLATAQANALSQSDIDAVTQASTDLDAAVAALNAA